MARPALCGDGSGSGRRRPTAWGGLLLAALLAWAVARSAPMAAADLVRLVDGDVLDGEIIGETPDSITLRMRLGTLRLERARIATVLRTPPVPPPATVPATPSAGGGGVSAPPVGPGATAPPAAPASGAPPTPPEPSAPAAAPAAARGPSPATLGAEIDARVAGIGPRTAPEECERVRRILEGLPTATLPLLREAAARAGSPAGAAMLRDAAEALAFRREVDRNHPALLSPDPEERVGTVRALAASAEPRLTAILLRTLDADPAPEVRLEALRALGRVRDERAAATIIQALRDPDPVGCG
ncbi:MAG: HEAT repeat domain-containing protein, partial [Planctomycetes bacterium]|nr:HEAT repeat domain-containing protein [Planctomycetota bacterium]